MGKPGTSGRPTVIEAASITAEHLAAAKSSGNPWAAAYLRISEDPRNEQLGVTRQRADVIALAGRLKVALVAIFTDNDVSAFKIRREDSGWHQLLQFVRQHRPDFLLGTSIDRFGRRLTDLESVEEVCRETGLHAWTPHGEVFADPAWPILAGVAKAESLRTGERVRRAHEHRRSQGRDSTGGRRPFGYTQDRTKIVRAEARIVHEIADRLIAGESASSVGRDLERRRVPTTREISMVEAVVQRLRAGEAVEDVSSEVVDRIAVLAGRRRHTARQIARAIHPATSGSTWTPHRVRLLAANPRYAGQLTHDGDVVGPAAWPAILDAETHDAVCAVLGASAAPRQGRPLGTLLGGILRCGRCETPMTGAKSGHTLVYRCNTRAGGCGRVSRKRVLVDDFVTAKVLEKIDAEQVDREYEEQYAEYERLAEQELRLSLDISALRERFANRAIEAEDYFATLDALRKHHRVTEQAERAAQARVAELTSRSKAQRDWAGWTVDQRRRVISDMLVAVLIRPTSLGAGARGIREREITLTWR